MTTRRLIRVRSIGLALGLVLCCVGISHGGLIETMRRCFVDDEEPITLKRAAYMVDCMDNELFRTGTIGIKSPDVWGQNQMTRYRAEFENQMAQNLGSFQVILQAAQRRSDAAVLTSATSLAATAAVASSASQGSGLLGGTEADRRCPREHGRAPPGAADGHGQRREHAEFLRVGQLLLRVLDRRVRPDRAFPGYQHKARRPSERRSPAPREHRQLRHQARRPRCRHRADDPARPGKAVHRRPPRAPSRQRRRRPH